MSMEDLTAFFARLERDAALRDQALPIQGAVGAERVEGLCRLAREHGFEVTPDDLAEAAAAGSAARLDDESLDDVAGGCDMPVVDGSIHVSGTLGF